MPDRKVVFGRVRNSAVASGRLLMLAQQRQAAILDRVRAAGGVRVSELASEYGVSDMTIRRDLESLADRGLLAKVHGGATTVSPGSAHEPGFAAKSVSPHGRSYRNPSRRYPNAVDRLRL